MTKRFPAPRWLLQTQDRVDSDSLPLTQEATLSSRKRCASRGVQYYTVLELRLACRYRARMPSLAPAVRGLRRRGLVSTKTEIRPRRFKNRPRGSMRANSLTAKAVRLGRFARVA